ncbi:alpha/beta hydrolase [soil metagenome]
MLGAGVPALRIGEGPRRLVHLPGLTFESGLPRGLARKRALDGWDPLLDNYTVHRLSRKPRAAESFREMAGHAAAAIEEIGAPVDLMGFSTGGVICLHVAATQPKLVRRLVLVATGPRVRPSGREGALAAAKAVRAGRWRALFATLFPVAAGSPISRLVLIAVGWLFGPWIVGVPDDPSQLAAELEAWTREDASEFVPLITCPTLVIGVGNDRMFPPELIREWTAQLPDAQVVIIDGKGHSFPPEAITDHVLPFLG